MKISNNIELNNLHNFSFDYINVENGFVNIKCLNIENRISVYLFLKNLKFSERYMRFLRQSTNNIKINNKPSRIIDTISNQDILSLKLDFIPSLPNKIKYDTICSAPSLHNTLNILYEDDFFLIINKPSMLATIPSKSHYTDNLLKRILLYYQRNKINSNNNTPRIINRLDYDTAGIIIVFKNLFICSLLEECRIYKTYFALCEGYCQNKLKISKNILTLKNSDGVNIIKRVAGKKDLKTVTYAKPIWNNIKNNLTLFEINIKGGKTHQIRVHLSSVNLPIIADKIYGKPHNKIKHTLLVCKKIKIFHPLLKKYIHLEIPFEKDFLKFLKENSY